MRNSCDTIDMKSSFRRLVSRKAVVSAVSAIKRVFGDSVRSKTRVAQVNEVLLDERTECRKVIGRSIRQVDVNHQALNLFFATNDTTLRRERRCRLFEATRIALTSKPYLAASSSRMRRTSSTMGSLAMSYSSMSSSGVQVTGHSNA